MSVNFRLNQWSSLIFELISKNITHWEVIWTEQFYYTLCLFYQCQTSSHLLWSSAAKVETSIIKLVQFFVRFLARSQLSHRTLEIFTNFILFFIFFVKIARLKFQNYVFTICPLEGVRRCLSDNAAGDFSVSSSNNSEFSLINCSWKSFKSLNK